MPQKDKIRKRFDTLAKKRQYWRNRNKYDYSEKKIYFHFLVPKGLSILELGCGTGHLLNSLKPKPEVGIDLSIKMIDMAKKLYPPIWIFTRQISNRLKAGKKPSRATNP